VDSPGRFIECGQPLLILEPSPQPLRTPSKPVLLRDAIALDQPLDSSASIVCLRDGFDFHVDARLSVPVSYANTMLRMCRTIRLGGA